MPVKIRLARHGSKRKPFYYIVAADSRAPRDGRYIERIGSYTPNTDPASIDLNFDKAIQWLNNGAVPTDTCKAILSEKGVLYKNHLIKGIAKGALTEEQVQAKFDAWIKDKEQKIQAKKDKLKTNVKTEKENRLKIEEEVNRLKAEELAAKKAKAAESLMKQKAAPVEDSVEDSTEEVMEEVMEEKTAPIEDSVEDSAEDSTEDSTEEKVEE